MAAISHTLPHPPAATTAAPFTRLSRYLSLDCAVQWIVQYSGVYSGDPPGDIAMSASWSVSW